MRASAGSFLGGLEPPMLPGLYVVVQPKQLEPTRLPPLGCTQAARLPENTNTGTNPVPDRLDLTIATDNGIAKSCLIVNARTRPANC
jgi:hypothetical protein